MKAQRQRDAQERGLCDKRGRDWSEAAADLGAPRVVGPHQETVRAPHRETVRAPPPGDSESAPPGDSESAPTGRQ